MICNASVWNPLAGNNQFTQKTFSGEFLRASLESTEMEPFQTSEVDLRQISA